MRGLFEAGRFIEVWVQCALDVCRARDPKGLYRKADLGELSEFTGVGAPYEAPVEAELILRTDSSDRDHTRDLLVAHVLARVRALG